jgi:glycosyltransferase involved in cell wall biosynthesis
VTVVYLEFGEYRVLYGSAAALSLAGRQSCVIQNSNLGSVEPGRVEFEIGIDSKTKRVQIKTIDVPKDLLQTETQLSRFATPKQFLSIIRSLDPEALITDPNYWSLAKSAAKKLDIPLLLWYGSGLSILKLKLYLQENRLYSKLFTTPMGFVRQMRMARLSSFYITNDMVATRLAKTVGVKHVETIWPTYPRFIEKDAFNELSSTAGYVQPIKQRRPNPYVLSFIPLDPSRLYNTELRGLELVRSVALAMPDTDFVVLGVSIESIQNPLDYAAVKNLRFIRLSDAPDASIKEIQVCELYRNAFCVLCPYRLPGFSNRLLEAFFYGKATVTTSLTHKYLGLVPDRDVVFADTPDVAVEALTRIRSIDDYRRKFEDASRSYYSTHYSPETHAKALERVLEYVGC